MAVALVRSVNKQSLDSFKGEPFVCEPAAAQKGEVRIRASDSSARLQRLISETLANFDPEAPSASRLKASPLVAPVSLPRAWAKKAG